MPGRIMHSTCKQLLHDDVQVEQQLRQQLEVRMKALGRADERFAHLEGVMRRLAHSAVPLQTT